MKKATLFALATLWIISLLSAPTPAHADGDPSRCPPTLVCKP